MSVIILRKDFCLINQKCTKCKRPLSKGIGFVIQDDEYKIEIVGPKCALNAAQVNSLAGIPDFTKILELSDRPKDMDTEVNTSNHLISLKNSSTSLDKSIAKEYLLLRQELLHDEFNVKHNFLNECYQKHLQGSLSIIDIERVTFFELKAPQNLRYDNLMKCYVWDRWIDLVLARMKSENSSHIAQSKDPSGFLESVQHQLRTRKRLTSGQVIALRKFGRALPVIKLDWSQ